LGNSRRFLITQGEKNEKKSNEFFDGLSGFSHL